jgi:hypothetical protein
MIPDKIILTYKHKNIPSYVLANIKRLNPEKEILFFDDDDAIKFFLDEYDSSYVDFFHSVKLGCTKGDFFRYCYLLKYGGYYCDIDIQHIEPIRAYITQNLEFFSINAAIGPMTFQALLYCESEHPIIKDCLDDIMHPETAKDLFYSTTEHMYKNVKKYLNIDGNIKSGIHKTKNDTDKLVQIGQEVMINNSYACLIQNRIIAMSRYPDYKREQGFQNT